jgi:hypothetical protein
MGYILYSYYQYRQKSVLKSRSNISWGYLNCGVGPLFLSQKNIPPEFFICPPFILFFFKLHPSFNFYDFVS